MLAHRNHPKLALLAILAVLAPIAVVILLTRGPHATAQTAAPTASEELAEVIPVPLDFGSGVGLALIDRRHHTICIYQYFPRRDAHERLALVAARSFRYDTQLEQFNTAEPLPHEVRDLLNRARDFNLAPAPEPGPEATEVPAPRATEKP